MRKLFSIFTAMLAALAVSATPVVLPATLDVSNVSFRSEDMPDFVLAEGDYAGTYFDMGAHDNPKDTLLYAEWDVTIEPLKYDIDVVVYNTNSWTVQLYLLNQKGDTVKNLRYKGSSGKSGKFAIGSMDMKDLEAGNYKLRARAARDWSAMKLKEVVVKADYSGATVALPGKLLPAYAELSANASVTDDAIAFKPSTANQEYATWNVTFAKAGSFDVTIDMTASNGHNYGVALLSADGETEIGAVNEGGQKGDTGEKALGSIAVPAAGKYIVKLTNSIQWSEAVLNSITFAAPAPEHVYSVAGAEALMGSHWNEKEGNELELQDDGKYKLVREGVSLAVGNYEYKVVIDHKWNNGEAANNSVLSIDKAGKYDVTFTYDAAIPETGATAELKEEQIIIPTVKLAGISGWDGEDMTLAEDKKTCSIKKSLDASSYEFKVIVGGNWLGDSQEFTRENNSYVVSANGQNMKLAADVAGEYTFTWTYETSTLAITFPEVVEDVTTVYDWSGEIGTTILGASGVEISTVKIHTNSDAIPGIKFGSSYVYADGKYIAIKPAKGGFKAGDKIKIAVCFNNGDDTKTAKIKAFAADGTTELFITAQGINGQTSAADPVVETFTLEADQDSIIFGRQGNTGTFITTLIVTGAREGETPAGCDWDNIDWLGDGSAEQTFSSQFKVCVGDPAPSSVVNIQTSFGTETGIYVTFPSAAFGAISLPEGKYAIQGAGMLLYVSAFTAKETEVSVVCDNKEIVFTVYNAKGTDTPTAIESNVVAVKAVKMIENGQLVIIRGGEKFNAQGQLIR